MSLQKYPAIEHPTWHIEYIKKTRIASAREQMMLLSIADVAGLPYETDLEPIILTTKTGTILSRRSDSDINYYSGIYIPQGKPYMLYSTEILSEGHSNNIRKNEDRYCDIYEIKKVLEPIFKVIGSIHFQIVRDRKIYIMIGLTDKDWGLEFKYLATRKCRIDKKSGERT